MAFGSMRRTPFLPHRAEEPREEPDLESLTEEFLNALPDVEPQEPPPFPIAQPEPAPTNVDVSAFQVLFETLQTQAHLDLGAQFARLHEALAAHMADVEARLAEAERTIEALRDENARLVHQNDLFERAFANLKELTQGVDDAR